MTSSELLCSNSSSVIDQFNLSPSRDVILIMTKPMGLFGGRKKFGTLFLSGTWQYCYRLITLR